MGAVDEADADQGVLGAEDLGVDLLQLVPAQVVIAVAGGTGEVCLRHPVLLEGRQDLLGILLGDGVNALELRAQIGLGLPAQRPDPVTDL